MVAGFQENKAEVHFYDLDAEAFLLLYPFAEGGSKGRDRFYLLMESENVLKDVWNEGYCQGHLWNIQPPIICSVC